MSTPTPKAAAKPKRALSAWQHFKIHETTKARVVTECADMGYGEKSKVVAGWWKAMDEAARAPYVEKAAAEKKAEREKELRRFFCNPSSTPKQFFTAKGLPPDVKPRSVSVKRKMPQTTYFATRLGGGAVFETSAERSEFLDRVQGSHVGNTKNFATRDEAAAYAKTKMVAQWPRKQDQLLQQQREIFAELHADLDSIQADHDAAQALIREHARTNEELRQEIAGLNESLRQERAKTAAVEEKNKYSAEHAGRVQSAFEASRKRTRLLEEQLEGSQEREKALTQQLEGSQEREHALTQQLEGEYERRHTYAGWLRASLDLLHAHTDESPEMLVAGHLCHQGKADLAASDIVAELPTPVLLHKKGNMARFFVFACAFTLLFQVMATAAFVMGFQQRNPPALLSSATPSAAPSMDLCVGNSCSLDMAVTPRTHDFTVLASLITSPFCGMMVAAFFI